MSLLIHVAVPLTNIAVVQTEVERCCRETHDLPIGRRVYEEVGEVLIVVRLIKDHHITQHSYVLNQALQQNLILSFQFESTNLIIVTCNPGCHDIRHYMSGFPLQPNESWFPAIRDSQTAYLCSRSLLINPEQSHWLSERHLEHQYL